MTRKLRKKMVALNKTDNLAKAQATAQAESEIMRDEAWARLSEFKPVLEMIAKTGIEMDNEQYQFALQFAVTVCLCEMEQRKSRIITASADLIN